METPGSFGYEIVYGTIDSLHQFLDLACVGLSGKSNVDLQDRMNLLFNEYIRLRQEEQERKAGIFKDRRINKFCRRNKSPQFSPGSYLGVVTCLEQHAKTFGLTEDQREVLADAQSRVRLDGSANGFRMKPDRRKF